MNELLQGIVLVLALVLVIALAIVLMPAHPWDGLRP